MQVKDEGVDPSQLSFQDTYGDIKGHAWCHHAKLLVAFQAGGPSHSRVAPAHLHFILGVGHLQQFPLLQYHRDAMLVAQGL